MTRRGASTTGAVPVRSLLGFVGPIRLRQRWRNCIAIALLMGITLGVSLAAIAGARRTQSSYDRFLRDVDASTLSLGSAGTFSEDTFNAIAAFEGVTRSRIWVGFSAFALIDGKPDPALAALDIEGSYDGQFFDQDRFTPTEGRAPDPSRPDEIAVNQVAQQRFPSLYVGRKLQLGIYPTDAAVDPAASDQPPPTRITTVTVVGIGVFPDEVLQDETDRLSRVLLTPALSRSDRSAINYGLQHLQLEHGAADIPRFQAQVAALGLPGAVLYHYTSVDQRHARRALRPLSIALALFGIVTGIVGLALGGQALLRLQRLDAEEGALLSAFGAPPTAVAATSAIAPMFTSLAAALLAGALAITLSALMPLGPVGDVAGRGSINIDATVIGFGVPAIIVAGALVVWRAAHVSESRRRSRPRRPHRPSTLVASAASMGAPPTLTTGIGMAVDGGTNGRNVAVRSVIAGTALAVATLITTITFGTNLRRLTATPRLYGWNWDAAIVAGAGYSNFDAEKTAAILSADHNVAEWAGAYYGQGAIEGRDVPMLGMRIGADIAPPIIRGRSIQDTDEIVLGAATAASIGKGLGDTVTVTGETTTALRVVGIAIFPTIGKQHLLHVSLGNGALVVPELVPGFDRDIFNQQVPGLGPNVQLVRFAAGVDHDAQIDRLRVELVPLRTFAGIDVFGPQRPIEIINSASLRDVPLIVAASFAGLAAVSLGLALGASVRRRNRDLAVLRSLGFSGRQLAAAVRWHATTVIAIGLLLGVPVGVISSVGLWTSFADQLDVVSEPHIPVGLIAAVTVAAVIVANVVGSVPARTARRVEPAMLLRGDESPHVRRRR